MPREYVKFDVDGNPYIDPKIAKIIDKAWRAGKPATQLKHAQKGDSRGEDTLLESGQEYKDVKKECRVGDVYVGLRATGKNATFLITDITRKGFTSIPGFTCHHEGLQKDKDGVKCQSCSIAVSYLPYGRMRDFRFDDPQQKNGILKARDAVIRDRPRAVRTQLSDMVVATTVLLPPFSQGRNASLGYTMFHYNQAEEFTWDNHNIVRQLGFMQVDEAKKMSEARMTVATGDLYMTRAGIEKGRLRSVVEQNLPQEKLWTEEEWTAAKNKLKHIKNGSAIQATELLPLQATHQLFSFQSYSRRRVAQRSATKSRSPGKACYMLTMAQPWYLVHFSLKPQLPARTMSRRCSHQRQPRSKKSTRIPLTQFHNPRSTRDTTPYMTILRDQLPSDQSNVNVSKTTMSLT